MATTTRLPDPVRSFLAAIALGGGGLAVGTILVVITQLAALSAGVELTPLALVVISLVLLQGIAFGGVALVYTRYRGLDRSYFGVSVPSLRDIVAVVLGYVTALVAAFVGAFLVSTFGVQAGSNQVTEIAAQDPEVLLLLIPASFLLIGPGEELLFRGVVQNRIRESFGPVPGIALASAIFAAIHYVALTGGAGGRLVTIGILFFPSVVFGSAYELTDNIAVPALIHGAYNATLFSLAYLVFKFAEMNPGEVPTGLLF
ncbi:CPBP family intramembrane metalloprotease [Haloferax sp. Atlit-12N]|uniref:CPBP family intramembrane glutamic endopeptidase n=1 Tax=Haloferax sp. Atlit-12N TaxID=2077203 RepID=UPI000E25AB92|nr:type II CAAX endopeptidase family protein [Haloferax sp. Atlit-12N]RDZ63990.1 CPBP family intramembrane metalloprotease [Haloferax sp. Atlit-12N]